MEANDKNIEKKFQKSYFDVLGLCCSSEIPLIERILTSLDGVKDFSVIVPTKTVVVVHDSLLISQIQIVKALNQARLEANIKSYSETNHKKKWPSPCAIVCGALLLLSLLKFVYAPLQWLAIGAVAFGIYPILLKAFVAVRSLRLDINILVLITIAGSIALHDYLEAATIVFLFTIAEWLESLASHKATAVMSSLVNLVPQRTVLADSGEEVNADEVKLNTILAVKTGEIIPLDGVVVEGNCEVDEKILTGESFPVAKQKDSTVWASTINLNGYMTIKTTAIAEDCVVARMAKLVEEAQNQKSRTQRFLDECAKYYTPAIVVISASIALVPLVFHVQNRRQWYHLALVVLVSGCPCALLLSTPVAMFCALTKAAKMGVLFKGAVHLETLAKIKVMAFDKTGTITRGEFVVSDFRSLQDDISFNDLLYWISSIESKSSHPMAAALVDYARTHSIEPKPDEVKQFQNFPGEGISGKIEDKEIYVGNPKMASRAGCTEVPTLEGYNTGGKSVGYVFLGSSPAGIFCISDICRTGAKEAIRDLKALGIKTAMLTGDCHGAAKHAREQLGGVIEVVHAELLPQDKGRIIKELQKEGPTAMIGDGVNDAPALATADIGISMGISGSALAKETGDIILMSNDIQRIPKAARLAKKVKRKIIENVIISILTKAAVVGLAIAGHPLVWAAVATDVGTCLLVIFNSRMLLRGTHSHDHKHQCKTKGGCWGRTHGHCSDIESQNKCEPRSCSSKKCGSGCGDSSDSRSKSCGTKKCESSCKGEEDHHHHHNYHSHKETRAADHHHHHHHHSHKETRAIDHHLHCQDDHSASVRVHDHCCSENRNCDDKNKWGDQSGQMDPNSRRNEDRLNDTHQHGLIHSTSTCKNATSSNHCHEIHRVTRGNEEFVGGMTRKQDGSCCENAPRKEDGIDSGCGTDAAHDHECGKRLSHDHDHTVDTLGCGRSITSNNNLRHGSCCHSFRRECCLRNEQFGVLSEIVIE